MKKLIPLSLLLLFVHTIYSQTGGTWTQKPDVSTLNRESGIGFSISDKSYIGLGNVGGSPNGALWEFSNTANTWTQKANMTGGGRVNAVAFVISGVAYVGTGENVSFVKDKKFYQYNSATNTWTAKLDFGGTARTEAVGFAIGSKGYIGTGNDGTRRKDFWEYDPTANTWTQKADFGGTARQGAVGFAIGTKGYIGTGNDGSRKKDFWEYDPATNAWTQKADFGGAAREGAVGFAVSSKGYIATGDAGTGKNDIWEYTPASDEWIQRANFPGQRRYVAVGFGSSYYGKGYIGTGFTDEPSVGVSTRDFYEFTPPVPPTAPTNGMITSFTETSIRFNWFDRSGNETGFIVERSTNGTTFTTLTTTAANVESYTDQGLTTGQTYYYRARATSAGILSTATSVVSQTTGKNPNGVWITESTGGNNIDIGSNEGDSFVIDNTFYFPHVGTSKKEVWAYNSATGTYTQKADFAGVARYGAVSFAINGKGYTGTGSTGNGVSTYTNDIWEYDPASNQWTQKANVGATGRINPFVFTIGSKAYLGSGRINNNGTYADSKDVYEFDPLANTWTAKADLPGTAPGGNAVSYNNKGYVLLDNYNALPYVFYEYDLANNSWTAKASFPIDDDRFRGGVMLQNRIFFTSYTSSRSELWEYEIANDRWIERALHSSNSQMWNAITIANSTNIYLFYGQTIYKYDPLFELKPPTPVSAIIVDPEKVKLSWTTNDNSATTTSIYRSTSAVGLYEKIAEVPITQITYIDNFNNANTATIYYKFKSKNAAGESDLSASVMGVKEGAWKQLKSIPISNSLEFGLGELSTATSTKGYIGSFGTTKSMWEYNPESDSWTQKANLPGEARSGITSFTVQDKIYVGLGSRNTSDMLKDFWQYDPATNAWTQKKDFAGTGRRYVKAAVYNGNGYIIGGEDVTDAAAYLAETWKYNPTDDSWEKLADAPKGMRAFTFYAYDNKLTVVNGYVKYATNASQSERFTYQLDLATNTWRQLAAPDFYVAGFSTLSNTAIINNTAYTMGASIYAYGLTTGQQWVFRSNYPGNSYSVSNFSLNNKIYAVGNNYDVWVYNPEIAMAAPENLTSQFLGDRILLRWQNVSTTSVKTKIQYTNTYSSSTPTYQDAGEVSEGISQYVFTKVESDRNYKFRVLAVDEDGNQSAVSNVTFENSGPYWTKLGNAPDEKYRTSASIIALNGKLYYGLGLAQNPSYAKDFWEYNPATSTWTQKADFGGEGRYSATSFSLGADIYIGFGVGSSSSYLKDLWKYTPATNTWTAAGDYPGATGIESPGVFTWDGAAYLACGQGNSSNASNELWKFDGTSWSQLASLPGDVRRSPIAFAINGKGYVGAGQKVLNGSYYSGSKDFWEYTISTDTWKQLKDLPTELNLSNRIYTASSSSNAIVFAPGYGIIARVYSPALDKWGTISNPFQLEYITSVFHFAQDPSSGFGYAIVNSTSLGNKLWRFNYVLNGPNLVVANVTSPGVVSLKWRKITPQPDSVAVFRSELSGVLGTRVSSVKTADTTAVNNVAVGKTYYYSIRSYSNSGQYLTSAERMVVVDALPAVPINLTGELVADSIVLKWDPATSGPVPTAYVVERAINDGGFVEVGTSSSTRFGTKDLPGQRLSYRVKATNASGSSPYSNTVLILVTGIEAGEVLVKAYPNPATDYITVQLSDKQVPVAATLYDNRGRKLYNAQLSTTSRIDLTSYPAGIYVLTVVNSSNGSKQQVKIVKQ